MSVTQSTLSDKKTNKTYAWINETLSNLLPLPRLDAGAVMAGVIRHDPRLRHLLLFGRQPAHFGRRTEEEQTRCSRENSQGAEELDTAFNFLCQLCASSNDVQDSSSRKGE
jgi:hypothetical protein